MFTWTLKTLLNQRLGLLVSATGVAAAFVLVVFFEAVFAGESTQIIAYIQNTKADIWVMQKGVSNMHMASSYVRDWRTDKVAAMPGVKNVTPILYLNTVVKAGGRDWFCFVVGLEPGSKNGGPWKMAEGRSEPARGEVVIPRIIARLTGTQLGDEIRITDMPLRVVGLSEGSFSMANSVMFVHYADLADIIDIHGLVSYLLVEAMPGTDINGLTNKIKTDIDKVNAMSREDFIVSDYRVALMMGVEIVSMMTVIGTILAALIMAFTAYMNVVRRRRELAIAKALGMSNRALYVSVILQSCIITLLGFLIATGFAYGVMPYITVLVPQVTLVMTGGNLINIGLVALIIAIFAALVPAWLVGRVDPVSAFKV